MKNINILNPELAISSLTLFLLFCSSSLANVSHAQGGNTNNSGVENILLIVADDMGADNVTAYGEHSQSAYTPTLDRLAEEGILFRNAWANPSCAPTRGALMTGRHAFRNGVTHPNAGQNVLDTDEITIAEVISEAGYQTALFGKWHLGNGRGANVGTLPTDQGFDHFSGHINGNIVDYFGWPKATLTAPGQTVVDNEITETEYATQVNTQEAVSWINATTDPWLAIVSYAAPHSPFHVPPEGRYSNVTLNGDVGDICDGRGGRDSDDDCYRAMAETMDSYINDLLTQIDSEKMANTLVIFMGDNGTPTQTTINEGTYRTDHAKATAFQGGVRVPFIVAGGSDVNLENTELANLIHVTDLFPTIIDIAGAQQPEGVVIDGQSFLGHISSEVRPQTPRTYQFAESINGDIDQWAINDGSTKYISDTVTGNRGSSGCYDLIGDPGELNPNSGNQAVCDELEQISPRNAPDPLPNPTPSPIAVQIEAEDYVDYFDLDERNRGGEYRQDGVDIQTTSDVGGGYNVGWIDTGEWLEYTATLEPGTYNLIMRVASRPGGGAYSVSVDGQLLGTESVNTTGNWQEWIDQDVDTVQISEAGEHTVRINISAGSFNINWLRFEPQ